MPQLKALAQEFLKGLEEIKTKKGNELNIEDIERILHSLKNDHHDLLVSGLQEIAGKLSSVKVEISHSKEELSGTLIPGANLELDEVVKHTEEAANSIMDAAEAIQSIAGGLDAEIGAKILEETTKIFEASNFQDITGQRIRKVIKALLEIDTTISELMGAMAGNVNIKPREKTPVTGDKALMNGPQLTKDTPSQDDIDRLFAGS